MSDSSSAQQQQDDDTERDALIAAILAAFLLTSEEIQQLALSIYAARLAALKAAYTAAADEAGADVPDDWAPDDDVTGEMADAANEQAQHIADTHEREMRAAAVAFLLTWQHDHDGKLEGAGPALRQHVGQWCDERASWKSEQIAGYESALGAAAGTDAAASDLLDGTLTDANGDPIDASGLVAAVLPDGAAEPFCAEYAGNFYPLDAADYLASLFPAHPNCPHGVEILLYEGGDVEDDF